MKIGEFFISLFVDAGKGELTVSNLVSSMGALEVATVGEIAALFELANKLAQITEHSIRSALGFRDYAAATGASTEALQHWQAAAAHVGISGETVQSSLEGISSSLEGLIHFGDAGQLANLIQPLHMSLAGFKPEKPEQILQAIRNSAEFQGMAAPTQSYILNKAGIGGLLKVLTKHRGGISDAEFARFVSQAGAMPSKDIEKWTKVKSDLTSIWQITVRIQQVISSWFSGPLLNTLDKAVHLLGGFADQIDDRNKPTPLATAVKKGFSFSADLAKGAAFGDYGDLLKRIKENISLPSINPLSPSFPAIPGGTKKEIHIEQKNQIKIEGSKMSKSEILATMKDFHDSNILQLTTQLNNAPV